MRHPYLFEAARGIEYFREFVISMLADLVLLGRDPFKEDPSNIINIRIERTMTGGKWVFES